MDIIRLQSFKKFVPSFYGISPVGIYLFKVNNGNTRTSMKSVRDSRTTLMTSFLYLYVQLWADFSNCFGVSVVYFDQVNADWKDTWKWFFMIIMIFRSQLFLQKNFIMVVWQGSKDASALFALDLTTQKIFN